MPTYAALLGHQPHISIAELAASVPGFKLQNIIQKQYALFESDLPLPPEFIHTLGDAHIYNNHIEQSKLQLTRTCRPLPKMKINPEVKSIFEFIRNFCV